MADVISLWPDGAPGSEGWGQREQDYVFDDPWPHRVTRNVTDPTLTVFLPEPGVAAGTGVVVCPGGAHHFLAVDHEGHDVAHWLNERRIAAFVLKYRVMETPDDDLEFLEVRSRIMGGGGWRSCSAHTGRWPLPTAGRRCVWSASGPRSGA
ncbi:MAG: hypothetical protein M3281_03905 [Chloroflexota bacterium]|nr:hypothetical protein [Chloroflexota bacterium]